MSDFFRMAVWLWLLLSMSAISGPYSFAQLPRPVAPNRIDVATEPGNDFGEKLSSCIRRLMPSGGTCDARSISGRQRASMDPFVQKAGPLRILLGNITVEASQSWGLQDDIEIEGKGGSTVVRLASSVNGDLIRNAGGEQGNRGIFLHDLTLDGNNAAEGGLGSTIHLVNVLGFTIERVKILNSVIHGIALDNGCSRGRILNNHIEGVLRGAAIRAGIPSSSEPVSLIEIKGNEISRVEKAQGILVLGSLPAGGNMHDFNIAENVLTGIKTTSIEIGAGAQNVNVTGNKIELKGASGGSSGAVGIAVRSAQKVQVDNNTVSGDTAEHDQIGLLAWSPAADKGGPLSDVTMKGNRISDVAGYGILVRSGSAIHLLENVVRKSLKENIQVEASATGVIQQGNN